MRVLLDESVPHRVEILLPGHDVSTVQGVGWSGIDNGALLRLAADSFDVFVTADRGIEHQQNLRGLDLAVIVLVAKSNRFEAYAPLANSLVEAVADTPRGTVVAVSG